MPLIVPCASHPSCPEVEWYLITGTEPECWAVLADVAGALGMSARSLRQWVAPSRSVKLYDVSDRIRTLKNRDLPSQLATRRGRTFISGTAVAFYREHIQGKKGPKRRRRLTDEHHELVAAAALPLDLPQTLVTDLHVALDQRVAPRGRFVREWLRPLARKLGFGLVSLPAESGPTVNVCTVVRERDRIQPAM